MLVTHGTGSQFSFTNWLVKTRAGYVKWTHCSLTCLCYQLFGVVVKAPASRAADLGFFFFFFCVPQLYLWGLPFWLRFLRIWPFFKSSHWGSCIPSSWIYLGLIPAFSVGIFFGSSHTRDLNIGSPAASLPGAWCYRVSTRTGWPHVSILWMR